MMVRGTFANIRLLNKFLGKQGPRTIYIPTKEEVCISFLSIISRQLSLALISKDVAYE